MQAQIRTFRTVLFVLLLSLILSSCSGADGTGRTWFNLPSVPVALDANGNGSVLGFPIGYLGLPPATIGQLQAADVELLEVRIGFNGVFVYNNGSPLPYVSWNDDSVELLQQILSSSPDVPNGGQIASALPWLRRIGTGVLLKLPGASASASSSWTGEELAVASAPAETTLGPFQFGGLAFDEEGNASIEGIPLSQLEQALGTSFGLNLPPNVLALLNAIGADALTVATEADGIALSIDGQPLPSIAYDAARLENSLSIAQPFLGDSPMAGTVEQLVTQLPGADIDLVVSFTGEPAADTALTAIPLTVNQDGTLSAFGLPLGTDPIVPADTLAALQDANVQKLDVNVVGDNLYIAANQQFLPTISWSPESLDLIQDVAGDALGLSPDLLGGGLSIVRNLLAKTDVGVSLDLPVAEGQEAVTLDPAFSATEPTFAAPADPGSQPDIQLGVGFNAGGGLDSLAGIPIDALSALGVPAINLPANIQSLLTGLGAGQIQLATMGNSLELMADDNRLLALTYDNESLERLLGLAGALTGNQEQIESISGVLPQVLSSNINLVASFNGEAPETRLTALPIALGADGSLSIYGLALGDAPILQPQFIEDLQTANIQQLDANIIDDSLYLATNGEALPVISWTDESLVVVQEVVGNLLNVSPGLLATGIAFLQNSDVGLALAIPTAEGAEPVAISGEFDPTAIQMAAPDLGENRQPVLQLGLTVEGSEITSMSGIPASAWRELGVPLPSLPGDISAILYDGLNADTLQIVAMPNGLQVQSDTSELLTLSYDSAAIERVLKLAMPFLPASTAEVLSDPNVADLLLQEFIPLVVGADVNLTAVLE